jgi:hypothetical protein
MSSDLGFELHKFHQFLAEKLAAGEAEMSPEEALDQWRAAHPDSEEFAADLAAVREALDDMAHGDEGTPLAEFDRGFRQRHGLPAKS